MKRTRLKPISDKKQKQIQEEYPIRVALCERAGGEWRQNTRYGGYCSGGLCEVCGSPPGPPDFKLHPHEDDFQEHRGRHISLEHSKMVCTKCGAAPHGIIVKYSEPKWSKNNE